MPVPILFLQLRSVRHERAMRGRISQVSPRGSLRRPRKRWLFKRFTTDELMTHVMGSIAGLYSAIAYPKTRASVASLGPPPGRPTISMFSIRG